MTKTIYLTSANGEVIGIPQELDSSGNIIIDLPEDSITFTISNITELNIIIDELTNLRKLFNNVE